MKPARKTLHRARERKNREKRAVLARLERAVAALESCPDFAPLIPEVRTNIAFCLPDARTPEDVAAIDGRITVVRGRPRAAGPARFGASDHLARLIIQLRTHNPRIRAALNFRWNEELLKLVSEWAQEKDLRIGVIDRAREPAELIGKEKMSIPWKVQELLSSTGGAVPEIFYETRGWGKEPLFVIVGSDPAAIVQQAIDIARRYAQHNL